MFAPKHTTPRAWQRDKQPVVSAFLCAMGGGEYPIEGTSSSRQPAANLEEDT